MSNVKDTCLKFVLERTENKYGKCFKAIISNLVEDANAVEIKRIDSEKTVTFEVKVADSDMGRVIGKQGRLAKSIRTVMKAMANKEHKKVTVEFIG